MLCHVDSKRSTSSLQTTNDEVRDFWVKIQWSDSRSNRHLNVLAWSPSDDNLAHMATGADVRQNSGDVIKTERRDRMDRLDVAVVDEVEQLLEKSAESNVSIAVSRIIGEDIVRDQSFVDVLDIREVNGSERAVAFERFHGQGVTIDNVFLANLDVGSAIRDNSP